MKYRSYKSKRSNRKRNGGRRRLQAKLTKRPASDMLPRIAKYARTAYNVGRAVHKSYTKIREYKRARRPAPKFNTGYTITNMKARNTAKRSMRHRRISGRDIAKALMARVSYNNYRINEIETGLGAVLIPNTAYGTGGSGSPPVYTRVINYVPLQMYTLDTTNVDGNLLSPSAWQLYYDKDTVPNPDQCRYLFENKLFLRSSNDGEATDTPSYNYSVCPATQWNDDQEAFLTGTNRRKWYQKRINVEMVMYGQTNQDTLYRVDVVQFDPRIAESFSRAPDFPAAQSTHLNEWNQLWHSLVAPYTQNPMHKPARQKGLIKIVKSYKFKIPEQSADFDRVPCVKTKFTLPMNRVINRYWKRGATTEGQAQDDPEDAAIMNNPLADQFNLAETDGGFIDPKYRYFLMVRATNNDRGTIANGFQPSLTRTSGQDPTYDIKIRSEYLVDV